jgi:hypothetical protein
MMVLIKDCGFSHHPLGREVTTTNSEGQFALPAKGWTSYSLLCDAVVANGYVCSDHKWISFDDTHPKTHPGKFSSDDIVFDSGTAKTGAPGSAWYFPRRAQMECFQTETGEFPPFQNIGQE